MDYRVYKDSGKGYKHIGTYDLVDTIFLLDMAILEQKTNSKILVIWHDYAMDCDFPFYLYSGNEQDYINFKDNLFKDDEVKLVKM